MTLRYLIFFSTLTLSSCHFFEPRDESNDTVINGLTELKTLPGNWKATETTYALLKDKKYHLDSAKLVLNKDSTFEFYNLPDCINSPLGDPIKGKLGNAKGKWNIYHFGDKWKIQMAFEENELFDKKTFLDFDIVLVGSKFRIWQYIGDPDQADVLEFEKAK
jgi:hypothetical protein